MIKIPEKEIDIRQNSEEVRDIIERMPNDFARNITFLVVFILSLLVLFGYLVKYPDIVTGEITISAEQAPLQLVAFQNGKLKINKLRSQDTIHPGQLLAWIDNPAEPTMVFKIRKTIDSINFKAVKARVIYTVLPKDLNLGDLTAPYSSFLSSIKQLADYQDNRVYDKQGSSLMKILSEQNIALKTFREKEALNRRNLEISNKYLQRDSILLSKKLISDAEYEQSIVGHLRAEEQLKSSLLNSGSVREQINNTENSLQQNGISKSEKEMQLELELFTAFNNLIDKINLWEKQYLIISPIGGKVQFLKFWNDNQFVQAGEPIFSIVPKQYGSLGKVFLPINGAGKVATGQRVIVKLADYPYLEYGYIEALVKDISLVSNPIELVGGAKVDSYLVTLNFPNDLTTNYGSKLVTKFEAKGSAEIVTKDRRLIERFFDNLKYIDHSK